MNADLPYEGVGVPYGYFGGGPIIHRSPHFWHGGGGRGGGFHGGGFHGGGGHGGGGGRSRRRSVSAHRVLGNRRALGQSARGSADLTAPQYSPLAPHPPVCR
jgi:hypothetical protein